MKVAIAGSGAIGAFTGNALRALGIDVSIFESRTRVAGASARAFGGIRQQFTDPAEIELAQRSLPTFEALPSELFTPVGYLYLATDDATELALRNRWILQRSLGVTCEWLDRSHAARVAPGLVTTDIRGALFGPRDGAADPHAVVERALQTFESNGGTVHAGTPLPNDVFDRFDVVVIACGSESPAVLASLGLASDVESKKRWPIRALKRSLAETTEVVCDAKLPLVIETHDGFHFRRRGSCIRLAMADSPPQWTSHHDPAPVPDADFGNEPLRRLQARLPSARHATIERVWSGLYDVTPDARPIIERVDDRIFLAAGFSGHGFMISPAVGERLATWIASGSCPIPLDAFTATRFKSTNEHAFPSPL